MPKIFLLDWRLCVACYCPTTTTEYTSTSRSTSVSSLVAVNINFWGYSRFLSISLFETNGYSTPLKTYRAKLVFSFISQCCYFNSQWTPLPVINKAPYVWKEICQLLQICSCSLLACINQGCGGVWEVEGVHSGSIQKHWPSRVLQHKKTLRYNEWEWTKFLQTSTHCLRRDITSFGFLKGLFSWRV